MPSKWGEHLFDLEDSLNVRVWQESPVLQRSIQSPEALRSEKHAGSQQAMLEPGLHPLLTADSVLPWVPDLVGKQWKEPESILIVGSAYAGFIRELSSRQETMPLKEYVEAPMVAEFQRSYLRRVVQEDRNYYGPLYLLAAEWIDTSRLALFDLCRASFVVRSSKGKIRSDRGGDSIVKAHSALYERYVESEIGEAWLWDRLTGGLAQRILALGTIAEHGLLRLFHRRGMNIRLCDKLDINFVPNSYSPGKWVERYAHPRHTLSSWLINGAWWVVEGEVSGSVRRWDLLPVYHPAAFRYKDPGYERTRQLLSQMKVG